MKRIEYLKVVLILPGNVLITIPLLIFLFTRNYYSYDLVSPYNLLFFISMLFLALGLLLAIWSVRTFYNKGGDGTPAPWNPINNLIISGPYRYVRNPMILGVVNLLLFESAFFTFVPFLLWAIIFFIGNIIYFQTLEEKQLIKRFGKEYEDYKNNVPMFFPKFTPYNKNLL
jgi:protein-S-isoprenylcysteine O-methyltransferase Ste14